MSKRHISDALAEARAHSVGNRAEIEASQWVECYSCCKPYSAKEVVSWRDEWTGPDKTNRVKRWSAICPGCDEVTMIGSASGLLTDQAYTSIINSYLSEIHAPNQ